MPDFEIQRRGAVLGKGTATEGDDYIQVFTAGGALLTTCTWEQLLTTDDPPNTTLVWPDQ